MKNLYKETFESLASFFLIFIIYVCSMYLALRLFGCFNINGVEMTQNGTNWVHVVPVAVPDSQTFVIHCQIGQFFRINSNKPTVITSFTRDASGYAIIHFDYLK